LRVEISATAKVPVRAAYEAFTNFETMPLWSRSSKAVKVLERQGDTVSLQVTDARSGAVGTRKLKLTPPGGVESESDTRFTHTKMLVEFTEVPEGTMIRATLDVNVRGAWSRILTTRGRDEVEPSARQELTAFVSYIEALSRKDVTGG
jgi:uncharacterized membrane protein